MCPDANSDCDHLFQGGAVDTIVRLPDDVGSPTRMAALSVLTEYSRSVISVRSDALCTRSKSLDQPVQLPQRKRSSKRCEVPLFDA